MVPSSILRLLSLLFLVCALAWPGQALWAIGIDDFPAHAPNEQVDDGADVLSRAAITELQKKLELFSQARIDARIITFRRLDYGIGLDQLAEELLQRWQSPSQGELLILLETGSNSASVKASPVVLKLLPEELLESTAETTMAVPLRDGGRYRQALLNGLDRLGTVLGGAEDPGPPLVEEVVAPVTNIPTAEETANSNAFSWVIVLLVVGTLVPMATWWVFSR